MQSILSGLNTNKQTHVEVSTGNIKMRAVHLRRIDSPSHQLSRAARKQSRVVDLRSQLQHKNQMRLSLSLFCLCQSLGLSLSPSSARFPCRQQYEQQGQQGHRFTRRRVGWASNSHLIESMRYKIKEEWATEWMSGCDSRNSYDLPAEAIGGEEGQGDEEGAEPCPSWPDCDRWIPHLSHRLRKTEAKIW